MDQLRLFVHERVDQLGLGKGARAAQRRVNPDAAASRELYPALLDPGLELLDLPIDLLYAGALGRIGNLERLDLLWRFQGFDYPR